MEELELRIHQTDIVISKQYEESNAIYRRKLREHAFKTSRLGYETTKLVAHVGPMAAGMAGGAVGGVGVGVVVGGPPGAVIGFHVGWVIGEAAGLYIGNKYCFHPALECWAKDPALEFETREDIFSRFQKEAEKYFDCSYKGLDGVSYLGRDVIGRLNIYSVSESRAKLIKEEIGNIFDDAKGTVSLLFRTAPLRRMASSYHEIRLDRSELSDLQKNGEQWICPSSGELFGEDSLMEDFKGEAIKHYCYAYFAHIQLEISKKIKTNYHLFETVKNFRDIHFELFNEFKQREVDYRTQKLSDFGKHVIGHGGRSPGGEKR